MNFSSYPFLLLAFFLLINLVIGFVKGRGVKTVSDFAVGDKNWGGVAMAATLLATCTGASSIYGTSSRLVSNGIIAISGYVLYSISFLLSSLLFSNQVSRFAGCFSFGDFIGKLYGNLARSFAGFFGGILCLLTVAYQIQGLGKVFNGLFGSNLMFSIICSTIIISLYTAFGGMRSVVATDIFQTVMIFGVLFALVYFVFLRFISGPSLGLPNKLLSMDAVNVEYCATRASVLLFLSSNSIPVFQRLLIAQNSITAKKMYLYTSAGNLIIGIMLLFIVFFSIMIFGNKLPGSNPINYIIKTLVPVKFVPLIGLGIMAVIFSTADSFLHSAGLCFSKDLLEPLIKRSVTLFEVRFITLFAGFLSMMIAFYYSSIIDLIWLRYLGTAILAVPSLYGFLGIKSSGRMFWWSIILGFMSLIFASYTPSIIKFRVIFACVVSLITYFLVHFYENKGFKFIGNPIFPREKDQIF